MVPQEYAAHTHGMFWTGMVLTPLLLQGWIPEIATFLNTPAWTMSAESFYYVLFPWLARWKRPESMGPILRRLGVIWLFGLIPGTLYIIFSPDGIAHPDRFIDRPVAAGAEIYPAAASGQLCFRHGAGGAGRTDSDGLGAFGFLLGIAGFGDFSFCCGWAGYSVPDPSRRPADAALRLHNSRAVRAESAGEALGIRPLVFVGEASYCLYLLHFNFWNLIHDTHVLNRLHLAQYDPWISYVL